jgi:gliding motility-associated protein GldM
MVAIFPQLTKMQLDVLNVEAEVVSYLLSRVDASDFKVNKLDAVVIPNSNYVFLGNDFVAEIFLAASDTTQVPKIYIGNYETFKTPEGNEDFRMVGNFDEIPIVNGRGIYKQKATRVALSNKWGGLIEVTAPDGTKLRRPFKNEYEVAQPSLVISPVKMNKFYRGVENPVEISIAGVSAEKIIPVIDHGSIKRVAGNEFIVLPGNPNQCNISVSADVDGVKRNMGSKPFRVENVPDPIASVAGVTSKNPTKGELGSALNVQATMPPGFDFEMKFTIISFTVMGQPAGYVETAISRSLMITEEQKRLVNSIRSGQPVSFTNIQAVGPDGSTRNLNDLVFTIR